MVQASLKVLHCGFKEILDCLLGTDSTRFKDQRSFEYYYNCVDEGRVPLNVDLWVIRFRLDRNILRKGG